MNCNLVLIGFMGAGKSLIAKKLAALLKREVIATDECIINREGRPINEIFRVSGEPYFRKVEKEVVAEVSRRTGVVIDCGGGAVLDPENIARLKENGTLFHLSATPDEIFRRVKTQKHRPLLNTENPRKKIEEMLAQRADFYAQADFMIDTNGKSPKQICEEIIGLLELPNHQ